MICAAAPGNCYCPPDWLRRFLAQATDEASREDVGRRSSASCTLQRLGHRRNLRALPLQRAKFRSPPKTSGNVSRVARACGRCIKIAQSWFSWQTTLPSTATGVDHEEMLEGLRSDAFQIRVCVLMALGQYMFSASSVGAAVNAHRAVAYLQRDAGQADRVHPGIFNSPLPQLSGRRRLVPTLFEAVA